jgi:hypothetical protein
MVQAMDHFGTYLRGNQFTVFTNHKPLETQRKPQDKTINSLAEAFLKYNIVNKYQKGSEKLAVFLAEMYLTQREYFRLMKIRARALQILSITQKHIHTHKNNCNCKHLDIDASCFTDGGIFAEELPGMANKNCNNTSKINAIQNLIKNSWG